MADLTPDDMASKLLTTNFSRSGPVAQVASDPIAETPMVITLDELRPYELDPRLTRNPRFDDIKASIRERGLDAPPPITRRPGANHYIIRNGGNTRLAILRELWSEVKDERFFRISCLFRPWPERGEIIALTGHLAENELHGGLTFIERTLGVEKARELYEQESGKPLSQSELARRLTGDGYPISQSQISRMQDTVRYLLPSIPGVLYQGLGRPQIEPLVALRKSAEVVWQKQANETELSTDFETLFHDVLMPFDTQPEVFSIERVRDELLGQMAKLLNVHYNVLKLDLSTTDQRQQVISDPPQTPVATTTTRTTSEAGTTPQRDAVSVSPSSATSKPSSDSLTKPSRQDAQEEPISLNRRGQAPDNNRADRVQDHIVSPAVSTDRLEAIQQLVAEHTGEQAPPVFADQALRAIPVQAGGLFPISDVWYIEPGLDSPERLRIHIAQFACEIAAEADVASRIEGVNAGIGFTCVTSPPATTRLGNAILALLRAFSTHYLAEPSLFDQGDTLLDNRLGALLLGGDSADTEAMSRLSDNGVVKLFRLIRLARRLLDLEALPDAAHP